MGGTERPQIVYEGDGWNGTLANSFGVSRVGLRTSTPKKKGRSTYFQPFLAHSSIFPETGNEGRLTRNLGFPKKKYAGTRVLLSVISRIRQNEEMRDVSHQTFVFMLEILPEPEFCFHHLCPPQKRGST